MEKDQDGKNALHLEIKGGPKYNAQMKVISKLVEIEGQRFVLDKDERVYNALQHEWKYTAPIEVISK